VEERGSNTERKYIEWKKKSPRRTALLLSFFVRVVPPSSWEGRRKDGDIIKNVGKFSPAAPSFARGLRPLAAMLTTTKKRGEKRKEKKGKEGGRRKLGL
jgi:hypothetical protein